jgi:hypothetical protein
MWRASLVKYAETHIVLCELQVEGRKEDQAKVKQLQQNLALLQSAFDQQLATAGQLQVQLDRALQDNATADDAHHEEVVRLFRNMCQQSRELETAAKTSQDAQRCYASARKTKQQLEAAVQARERELEDLSGQLEATEEQVVKLQAMQDDMLDFLRHSDDPKDEALYKLLTQGSPARALPQPVVVQTHMVVGKTVRYDREFMTRLLATATGECVYPACQPCTCSTEWYMCIRTLCCYDACPCGCAICHNC